MTIDLFIKCSKRIINLQCIKRTDFEDKCVFLVCSVCSLFSVKFFTFSTSLDNFRHLTKFRQFLGYFNFNFQFYHRRVRMLFTFILDILALIIQSVYLSLIIFICYLHYSYCLTSTILIFTLIFDNLL